MDKNSLAIFSFLLKSPPLYGSGFRTKLNRVIYERYLEDHSFIVHHNEPQFIWTRDMEIKWFVLIPVTHFFQRQNEEDTDQCLISFDRGDTKVSMFTQTKGQLMVELTFKKQSLPLSALCNKNLNRIGAGMPQPTSRKQVAPPTGSKSTQVQSGRGRNSFPQSR